MATPRSVRMTGTGWLNVFTAAFFFSIGVGLAIYMMHDLTKERATQEALQKDGIQASGQITSKWTSGKASVPYVSYTFEVNGTYYNGKSDIPKSEWRNLKQYDLLPIQYLAQDPSVNKAVGWKASTFPYLFGLIYPAFLCIFGLLIGSKLPKQRRLAIEGFCVCGSITECVGPSKNGFALTYTFRNATTGELEVGRCLNDHSREVGSEVCVLYLPTVPSRSEIYPFNVDLFRIIGGV